MTQLLRDGGRAAARGKHDIAQARQPAPQQAASRCLAAVLASGLLCGPTLAPAPAMAALGEPAPRHAVTLPVRRPLAPLANISFSLPSPSVVASEIVVEAEELATASWSALQHGAEAVGASIHHLQVIHALEQLEGMPLSQLVDVPLLKSAMHPAAAEYDTLYDYSEGADGGAAALDAALDAVADWRLRDVVDISKLALALQDVQYDGPLTTRALQQAAPRIRRLVHWEGVADAVRPQPLRRALEAMGGPGGSPFADLDIRAAVSSVHADAIVRVLSPPRPRDPAHALDASGMWTWETM